MEIKQSVLSNILVPEPEGLPTSAGSSSQLNPNLTVQATVFFPLPSVCPSTRLYGGVTLHAVECCVNSDDDYCTVPGFSLRGANEEDSQSHSLMFTEILHNPI